LYYGAIMMSRTQITLEPELQKKARNRAAQLGISMAEYIRRLVRKDVGDPTPAVDVTAIFDLGESAGSDVSREKDKYLAAAIAGPKGKDRSPA
jgi:hypothetical protein